MKPIPSLKLNDGQSMPQLGLGVWQMSDQEAARAVVAAVEAGYRLIDTAAIYANEFGVGQGLRECGVPREELFVTTKLWNDQHGRDTPRRALQASLQRLRTAYVDLYLIHWPVPRLGRFIEAWEALVELQRDGLARSIGVSNFNAEHLEAIQKASGVAPALNQIELHPYLQQRRLREEHGRRGIVTQAWSPLGRGRALEEPAIVAVAGRLGRTPAQVILRWQLQAGLSTIPKSVTPERIQQNRDVFDFELPAADLAALEGLERGERIGPDPAVFG